MPRSFLMAALAALSLVSAAHAQCVGYTLDSPPAFPAAGEHVVAVADMNGDGTPDLVASRSVFFDFRREVPLAGEAQLVADLDGDGRLDIVAVIGGGLAALMNAGDKFIVRMTSLPGDEQSGTSRLTIGDFTGEGVLDLVSGVTPELGAGDGTGGFRAPNVVAPTGAEAIVSGDFNGDGLRDLAVFYPQSLSLAIFAGRGNGTFAPERSTFGPASRLFAADFDGDGRDDILGSSTRTGAGAMAIAFGNPAIEHAVVADPAGNRLTDSAIPVAIGDVNGDGLPDVVATVTHLNPGQTTTETVVFLNDGRGGFPVSFRRPEAFDGALADFDGDGKLDLVTAGYFLHGNGDGSFRDVGHINAIPADFGAAADLDGDGNDELILRRTDTGNSSEAQIAILWREQNGHFTTQIINDPRVTKLAGIGDVNGDGRAELLVYSGAFLEAIGIDRSGSVQTIASVPVSFFGTQVLTGDFRGNGQIEIAMLANTEVLILDPRNTPALRASLKLSDSDFHRMAVADVNGDGRDDVIVGGRGKSDCIVLPCTFRSGGFLSLYLSTGSGFSTERQLVSKPESFLGSPAVGDFNGDGRIDIAAVAQSGGLVLLLGDGAGNFTIGSAALEPSIDAAAVDLNGDGIDDLVAWRDRALTVLTGSRSGFITGGTFLSAPLAAQVLFPKRIGQATPDIAVTQGAASDLLLLTPRCANRLRPVRR